MKFLNLALVVLIFVFLLVLKKIFFTVHGAAHGAEVCINNDYINFMSSLLPVSTNEPKPEKLYSNIHTKVVISQGPKGKDLIYVKNQVYTRL